MKVKVMEPISAFFKTEEIVEMTITSKRGDFTLSTDKVSQSFSSAYHAKVKPITQEEFEAALVTKIENKIIKNENS